MPEPAPVTIAVRPRTDRADCISGAITTH